VPSKAEGSPVTAAAGALIDYAKCALPARLSNRGWPTELAPTSEAEVAPLPAGAVTLIALPDTQYYASCRSPHLARQAEWILAQAAARNIRAVIQLGDLTDHNTPAEWEFVQSALAPVSEVVPLALATGNHDHGEGGAAKLRGSLLPRYFGKLGARTSEALTETKVPGDPENAYYRVKLPKVTLGLLVLEWGPRASSVAWANRVLEKYPADRVIFATHAYLYHDATRYDWKAKGASQEWNPIAYRTLDTPATPSAAGDPAAPNEAVYDGEMLWNDLLKRHRGVFLTLSGHVLDDGTAVLTSQGSAGNRVHQVLANYQMLNEGGLGYLRLLELFPDGKTLRMKTYSPSLSRFATGNDHVGDLAIQPPLW
jgi:3',5'-cyclic AMP phosphodiesterase CpdA